MKSTPSSTARRSTRTDSSWSAGGPQMPDPVIRMAPKPMRLTVSWSPIGIVPAAPAGAVSVMAHLPTGSGGPSHLRHLDRLGQLVDELGVGRGAPLVDGVGGPGRRRSAQ